MEVNRLARSCGRSNAAHSSSGNRAISVSVRAGVSIGTAKLDEDNMRGILESVRLQVKIQRYHFRQTVRPATRTDAVNLVDCELLVYRCSLCGEVVVQLRVLVDKREEKVFLITFSSLLTTSEGVWS